MDMLEEAAYLVYEASRLIARTGDEATSADLWGIGDDISDIVRGHDILHR